jgi:hypothetical protein
MNENMNNTPNTGGKNNPGFDQEFSALVQSAVHSALSADSSSSPDKEAFKKLLSQVPVASPYQGASKPVRSNFKRTNRMYSSVIHAWKVTVPVVALVLAVSGSTYYYQTIPVSGNLVGQTTSGLVASKSATDSATDFVADIESLINIELESELKETKANTDEDFAFLTSDSSEVKGFTTAGEIESLQ